VMLAVTLALALTLGSAGLSPALLIGAGLAIGVVDAFYLPASGTMPRRLTPGPALARAMAARQLTGQVAAFGGAPLGGLLVALAGLTAAALFDAATFALMFLVLLLIRPRDSPGDGQQPGPSLWRRSLDGLRAVAVDRTLRLSLLLVSAAAGLLLPVSSLLVPLLGRERGWSAGTAGLVVGTVALGTATVAIAVLARRASSRPGVAGPAGLLVAAAGVAGLALPVPSPAAVVLGIVIGLGTGVFTAHIGPLILGQTPASHLSRAQAALVLAQTLPLLGTITLLGTAADVAGTPAVLVACGIALAVAATAALTSPALTARRMGEESGRRPA
jgi:hypothetical protein